jgi:putative transcriptional regulator
MAAEITVAPGLLIAMPQLADPNFHRSVVLMIEHQPEGSFGLIVNRPTTNRVEELVSSLELQWRGKSDAVAWWGGPVQQDTGWILHAPVAELAHESTREITEGLHLSSAPDALRTLCEAPPARLRFILGYAGWGPEQLEDELREGAWVNSDVTADFLFDTPAESLWEAAVRRLGIDPEALVPASGVH